MLLFVPQIPTPFFPPTPPPPTPPPPTPPPPTPLPPPPPHPVPLDLPYAVLPIFRQVEPPLEKYKFTSTSISRNWKQQTSHVTAEETKYKPKIKHLNILVTGHKRGAILITI